MLQGTKLNCWEVLKCKNKLSCIAYNLQDANGFLNGKNGGHACMYVAGMYQYTPDSVDTFTNTRCDNQCLNCEFYKLVKKEEGRNMNILNLINYVKPPEKQDK